ncbi:Uncharacterised protein [uncultured archaeon]|nr:Uncharacterised protein [uncultured archaeon]
MTGGYIAGKLRTNGFSSGPVSGLVAGFIVMLNMAVNENDWRSIFFVIIITIIFVVGGGLGELIFNISKKK